MKRLHNKRGSYIILLTISLCAMMILVYAVFYASGQAAIGSTVRSFGALWGRSVLGEYDRVLKERYGIFAFYADPLLTERKLDAYTDYTCRGKTYLHSQGARVELEGYSITEAENFERQIKEAVLAGVRPSPLSARKRVCAHAACPCAGISQDAKNRPKMAFCLHPRKNYVKYYFPH